MLDPSRAIRPDQLTPALLGEYVRNTVQLADQLGHHVTWLDQAAIPAAAFEPVQSLTRSPPAQALPSAALTILLAKRGWYGVTTLEIQQALAALRLNNPVAARMLIPKITDEVVSYHPDHQLLAQLYDEIWRRRLTDLVLVLMPVGVNFGGIVAAYVHDYVELFVRLVAAGRSYAFITDFDMYPPCASQHCLAFLAVQQVLPAWFAGALRGYAIGLLGRRGTGAAPPLRHKAYAEAMALRRLALMVDAGPALPGAVGESLAE